MLGLRAMAYQNARNRAIQEEELREVYGQDYDIRREQACCGCFDMRCGVALMTMLLVWEVTYGLIMCLAAFSFKAWLGVLILLPLLQYILALCLFCAFFG